MKKLGTTLLLALSLLSVTACGKKDKNTNANYNCGTQYGYSQVGCQGAYGQPYGGQVGGYNQCGYGSIPYNGQCLQRGPCSQLSAQYGTPYYYLPMPNQYGQAVCMSGQQFGGQQYGGQYQGGYQGF